VIINNGLFDFKMNIIDVSDPSNPEEKGSYSTFNFIEDLHISGAYAYLTEWEYDSETYELNILNIADPANIVQVGSTGLYPFPKNIYVKSGYAYVANESYGLIIVDVTTPTHLSR